MFTVIAVCALGVTVFFVPAALVIRAQNQHIDQLELQRLAVAAARTVQSEPTSSRTWIPPDADSHHQYGLYDANGSRISGSGPPISDAVVGDALRDGVAAGRTDSDITAAAALQSGKGAVRVSESLEESAARTTATLARLMTVAAATVAVATLIGWYLVRRLLAPVTALQTAAVALGRGDFTATVPTTGLAEMDDLGHALTVSAQRVGDLIGRERAFSADASHQLRNPLAAATLALETELMAPRADPRAIIEESLQALTRLEHTITGLLRLTRDTATINALTELPGLFNDLLVRWTPPYATAGRPFTVRPATGHVSMSATALHHILDVLIDNALQHGRGEVTVSATPIQGGVAITVTDTGPGPGHTATLFARRDHTASGGIGLALARSLAEAEGARLTLRNPGSPTTFDLVIPHHDPIGSLREGERSNAIRNATGDDRSHM